MRVYYIRDKISGSMWARNRWSSATAVPDLYKTKAMAERQITKGKIGGLLNYMPGAWQPEIIQARLISNIPSA